jgi:hypothetical protein
MTATPAGSARKPKQGLTADAKHECGPRPAQCTGPAAGGRDVADALAALSAEHRQVIIEIYYHNRSVAETADFLRIPTALVASRADLATRQLARALTDPRRPTDPVATTAQASCDTTENAWYRRQSLLPVIWRPSGNYGG